MDINLGKFQSGGGQPISNNLSIFNSNMDTISTLFGNTLFKEYKVVSSIDDIPTYLDELISTEETNFIRYIIFNCNGRMWNCKFEYWVNGYGTAKIVSYNNSILTSREERLNTKCNGIWQGWTQVGSHLHRKSQITDMPLAVYGSIAGDINTTLEPLYFANKNSPDGSYTFIQTMFYNKIGTTERRSQLAISGSAYNDKKGGSTYHRVYQNNSWTPWRRHMNADEAVHARNFVKVVYLTAGSYSLVDFGPDLAAEGINIDQIIAFIPYLGMCDGTNNAQTTLRWIGKFQITATTSYSQIQHIYALAVYQL